MASVRVRVTLLSVIVTTLALSAGAWGLLRTVERTELARLARSTAARLDDVVTQLEAGTPTQALELPVSGFVQVIDDVHGTVIVATPGAPAETPIVMAAPVGADVVTFTTLDDGGGGRGPIDAAGFQIDQRRIDADGRSLTVVAASPLDEVDAAIDAVRRALVAGLPVVVGVVALVAWWVTGRALRPVEAMRAQVDAISHSTLHRRVPEPVSDDEIGKLARTMNEMLDRLEAASTRQRQFVADASHELRSPVAVLRTELEVALRTTDEQALRVAVEDALAEEARLEDLLTDLLVLASVEEGAPTSTGEVDLAAIVDDEVTRPRRVPVTVAGAGRVTGSVTQLRRAVANLVDNAARHARSSVTVTVDGPRLVVDDDGPGIADADRERVFERFTRLDEGRVRDEGGAGLGLALVRAVAIAHGGRAWAERAPSGGARLVVDLDS